MRRLASAVAVGAGLVAVVALTLAVFGAPVLGSLQLIAQGALGDGFAVSRTLVKTIPLIFTGLGMVVAWRAGMYNVGGEGQFVMGGLTAGFVAKLLAPTAPPLVLTVTLVLASVVGGGLWAGLAGWLRLRRGVEIVISTILLNFIAIQLLAYAVSGPLQERAHQVPMSDRLADVAMLAKFDRRADLHYGVFIALAAAILVFVWMFRTKDGYRTRLVGESSRVARANRMDADALRMRATIVSGALCGLAGGVEYVGVSGQLAVSFSQQWGFIAIPVALLAGLHPLGVLLSALFFGALFAGSENLARFSHAGTTMIFVVQAVAVLGLVAFAGLTARHRLRREPA